MVTSEEYEEFAGPDVVDLLHERHERIREAFTDVVAAEGTGKVALFDELVTLLAVHEAVEQELIQPLSERISPVMGAVDIRRMEEASLVDALARLSGMDVEDDAFDAQLIGVARVVTMHVQAEEHEELPRLREALPPRELRALAELMISAESIARTHVCEVQPEVRTPDPVGPLGIFATLHDVMRRANRP
jgi:hypothetical protein